MKPSSILTLLFLAASLEAGCTNKPAPEEPVPPVEQGYVTLVSGGKASAVIRSQQSLSSSAGTFAKDIQKATGAQLETITPSAPAKEGVPEIVIGDIPSLGEIIDSAKKELRHGYVIRAVGQRVLIFGTDDAWTVLGLEYFASKVLTNPAYCKEGTFRLPEKYSQKQDSADPQLIAALLSKGRKFDLVPVLVGTCPREGVFTVAQGAASDGEYVYFTMKGKEDSDTHDSQVCVYQYKLSPFGKVGVSETFNGHHANDMTYDSKGRRVLVVHGSGASACLTAIPTDPILGKPELITTSLGIGGITYNAKRDIYGITQGGSKYQTAGADFKMIKNFGRTDTLKSTYTAQGMGSDDSYVYFPMSPNSNSPEKVNFLVVYDWEGKYVGNLRIPLNLESESMFYAAGEYYVNFYNKAAALYRVYPRLTYQPQVK